MAVIDTGSSTAGKANVDATFGLVVNPVTTATAAGFVTAQVERDAGAVTATRLVGQPQTSISRRQMVGVDTLIFSDVFNATAQNTNLWRSGVTTFTQGLTGGYLVFNNGSVTTTGAAQAYSTWKAFPMHGQAPLIADMGCLIGAAPPSNWQADIGLFYSGTSFSSTWAATDGAYFRINSTGLFGVLNYNGTETLTGTLVAAGSIPVNSNFVLRVITGNDWTEFWWTDTNGNFVYLGKLATPAGNGVPMMAPTAPLTLRLVHSGVAGAAVQIKFSHVAVYQGDTNTNKPWSHQMAGMGNQAYQGTNGGTLTSTALYTNSLNQGAGAAATNTTAALGSGLGGQFSVQPTLAQGTDGIISSYQNTIGGQVGVTARTLYITGVSVQGLVTTAFTGGPVLYAYSLAYGHTAVSLGTTDAIAAKSPRRIALGYETYVVTAAVGALGQGLTRSFQTPIVVNPGEFIQLVAKNLGTVTSAGVIALLVTFDGYFE